MKFFDKRKGRYKVLAREKWSFLKEMGGGAGMRGSGMKGFARHKQSFLMHVRSGTKFFFEKNEVF